MIFEQKLTKMLFTPRSQRPQSRLKTIDPDLFAQKATKETKSCWYFCYQNQKQNLLGNWMQADTGRFVSFVFFCENGLENCSAPGGRAPPRKAEFELK